jgi:hypothetical protein
MNLNPQYSELAELERKNIELLRELGFSDETIKKTTDKLHYYIKLDPSDIKSNTCKHKFKH